MPPPFPIDQFEKVYFFHSRHMDRCDGIHVTRLIRIYPREIRRGSILFFTVGRSLWRIFLFTAYGLAYSIVFVYTPIILSIIIYSIILIKLKLPKTPGQQSTDAKIQRNKRNRNALKLAIPILLGLTFCKFSRSIIYI